MEVWNAVLMQRSMGEPEDARVKFNRKPESAADVSGEAAVDTDALVAVEVLPQLLKLERYQRRAEAYCRHVVEELGGLLV
jgi:hypothetical protein